ncbi:MAG: hypothetical protein KJ042_13120 [Deltaproteobacteria bacterium]|nr:hypothetical protein [Deltaproteobacteria bacterium]
MSRPDPAAAIAHELLGDAERVSSVDPTMQQLVVVYRLLGIGPRWVVFSTKANASLIALRGVSAGR